MGRDVAEQGQRLDCDPELRRRGFDVALAQPPRLVEPAQQQSGATQRVVGPVAIADDSARREPLEELRAFPEPVQRKDQGLNAALPEHQPLDGVEPALPAWSGVEALPLPVIGEEDGDLLAFPFEGGARDEDPLGEIAWRVGLRRGEAHGLSGGGSRRVDRLPALVAEPGAAR